MNRNVDSKVVDDFGDEWARHDQAGADREELRQLFEMYFSVFPWEALPPSAQGFDLGCGSGRWASFVAPRVGTLHCVDPAAQALEVAKKNLASQPNCVFHQRTVDALPFEDGSMDFGYSLGVLHHIPDTQAGMTDCVRKLKDGAPFLVYLYYSLDNRPWWFRGIWRASDVVRRGVAVLPRGIKNPVTDVIAATVYWPLARTAAVLERAGMNVSSFPLSAYRSKSFYTLRTDSRDRFGTRLEQRFSKKQIAEMMRVAGLERIAFREDVPFWCAVGYKVAKSS